MNLLFISNDPLILSEDSPVRARLRTYAAALTQLHESDSKLHVLTRAPKTVTLEEGPLVLHGVHTGPLGALRSFPRIARRIIQEQVIAVVSAQDPFEYGWIALRAVRGTDAALHVQLHTDFLSPWFTKGAMMRAPKVPVPFVNHIRRVLADRVLPRAVRVRVVSKRIRDSLITRYGERLNEANIIPIALPETLPPKVPLPAPVFPFTLLTVSRLEPEKRIEDLLVALAQIAPQYPAVGLLIAGDGRERARLERMARALRTEDRVRFLGWRTDAWGLMQSAQAYVQASAYEGYGLTLFEAALARLPIISTDVGIVGDILEANEDVLVVPPGDPTAIAVAIRGLVEDTEAREEFLVNAEKKAQEFLATQQLQPERIIEDVCAAAQ